MLETIIGVGTPAPDFSLQSTPEQRVRLAELRGAPLVIAFYPADFSPVCGDQMSLYNQILPEFKKLGANLVGISVDGIWCHLAFAVERKLRFPVLADSRRRETSRGATAYTGPPRARASARSSCSTPLASCDGATSLPSA